MKPKFQKGDRVKLTGKFLKNTGQVTGPEGSKTWTVLGFWGEGDRFALVDEPGLDGGQRSIVVANLYKVGTLTADNCP